MDPVVITEVDLMIYECVCADIDECQDRTHNCDRRSTCVDTDGSYICQCPHGFTGTGLVGGCEGKHCAE